VQIDAAAAASIQMLQQLLQGGNDHGAVAGVLYAKHPAD
jgi:hypothetical protein